MSTPRRRVRSPAATAALLLLAWAVPAHPDAGGPEPGPLALITRAEAALPPPPSLRSIARRPPSAGPLIEVASPEAGRVYDGPFSIEVRFLPNETGTAVNMSSLRLEYQRAWGIDITARVRDYLLESGISVPDTALPEGEHTVEIYIEDTEKRASTQVFTVRVALPVSRRSALP